jgi:hypothetical protein
MIPIEAMEIQAGLRVTVTLLGDHQQQLGATIRDRSGHVQLLETSACMPVGSTVQIKASNIIFLAEVLSSQPTTSGYAAILSVEHVLRDIDEYKSRFWSKIKSCSPVQHCTGQSARMRSDWSVYDAKASVFRMCETVWCMTASLGLEVLRQALGRG